MTRCSLPVRTSAAGRTGPGLFAGCIGPAGRGKYIGVKIQVQVMYTIQVHGM